MSFKVYLFIYFSFLLFVHGCNAFNITSLLGQYSDFSTFNNYISQNQLAGDINSRQTITVLVVSNGAISALSGKPQNVLKKIISVHVVLDYLDEKKVKNLPNKTGHFATLFQSTGQATGQQGFLRVNVSSTGGIAFTSAAPGSNQVATLVKPVTAQPYNISILEISNAIVPAGIEDSNSNSNSTSPPASAPANSPKTSPPPPPHAKSPAPASRRSPPGEAPESSGSPPEPADAPVPAGSPPEPAADAPTADAPAADGDNADSGTSTLGIGLGVAITIVLSTLLLMVKT